MPNPWHVGSARLLESLGFEALATTSAGFAWSLGKLDQTVSRDELVAHATSLAGATDLPLNVDSERCYPDDPGGVTRTVELLAEAGAAGFSIEDFDRDSGGMEELGRAAERVAEAAEQIAHVVDAVGVPLNVLALPAGPSLGELASAGVRRISTGSLLASAAYGALLAGARELKENGTSRYAEGGAPADALEAAFH